METNFEMRAYGVGELASLYRPHVAVNTARKWLRVAVSHTPGLMDELKRLGYHKNQKLLTSAQVEAIIRGIGGP